MGAGAKVIRSLIEQWFPAAAVGAESLRERGSAKAYPPINFLHVWWARRPLTTSRAAILASILPAWPTAEETATSSDVRTVLLGLQKQFPDGEGQYRAWFLTTIGILGDPVKARALLRIANAARKKLPGNGYGYERAFTRNPDHNTTDIVARLAALAGHTPDTLLDPFSGGGSIPFESLRLGLPTIANELNPVAAAILQGTIVLPFLQGHNLATNIKAYGERWAKSVRERLSPYFPKDPATNIIGYVWAHSIPCPTTGNATPLSPNFWLSDSEAVKITPDRATGLVATTIVSGDDADGAGSYSTYRDGTGISVWTNQPFDGDYIRSQAQSGHMSEMLLAVVYTTGKGRQFRAPSQVDLDAIEAAAVALTDQLPNWEARDLVPNEPYPETSNDQRPRQMGLVRWSDLFSPRQLLSNVTALEELQRVSKDAVADCGKQRGGAIALYLAFALDKAVDYNSRLSSWDTSRDKIRNTFDRHDFSFKWSFAEFEAARELIPWAVNNAVTNHEKICALLPQNGPLVQRRDVNSRVIMGSATNLDVAEKSVDAIVTDPPYYDNVMYAECSDFFYVWLKRALRDTWPEFCSLSLTDKADEAVANPALFKDVATRKGAKKKGQKGKSAAELADENYERLLTASFQEAHRVLKDNGVMTVMFTHKRVDAWDTLGMALLEAGFSIESSWPVHTESEHSLHQAKMNSASSTILLTCRKRQNDKPAFWNDIRHEIAQHVDEAVAQFSAEGMIGVDLTLATYGPALSVLSRNWPVYTGASNPDGTDEVIRPDIALNLARENVNAIKKRGLLGGKQVEFDRPTDWWLLAWSDFAAREFPSGEALKLSLATHLNLEDLAKKYRLLTATGGKATILTPEQRRAAKAIDVKAKSFDTMVDALHTFMLIYSEDGLAAARAWLKETGFEENQFFADLVRAAVYAIPRAKEKGMFVLPEAKTLESIRSTIFDEIPAPPELLPDLLLPI
jgi:putative DNA methylase